MNDPDDWFFDTLNQITVFEMDHTPTGFNMWLEIYFQQEYVNLLLGCAYR